jgi:hypothetical protein
MDEKKADFPWIKFKSIVFSNEQYDEIAESIIDNGPADLEKQQKTKIRNNIARVVKKFCTDESVVYQELDSVDYPELYTDDDVVEIFIRANAGGTRLGKSDLLFSLLTSAWDEADECMQDLLDDLNKSGYDFTRDFILKTCLSLLGKGARYEVAKFRDGETRSQIIDGWEQIARAIKDVRDFLFGKTFLRTDKAIPSYLGLIPLIYFRFHFPEQWKRGEGLYDYILRTLITGAFSGTPDNLIDKCTRQIRDNKCFDLREVFDLIRADGRSLEITADSILGQYYGSKNIHLLFNLWYKDFNYSPAYENSLPQVDHIFPQSLLRTVKDINPETGRRNILRYRWQKRDQIANCMLLTAEENGAGGKSDTAPVDWFADKPEEYFTMHLIPKDPDLWVLDNFDAFIEARKKLITDKFDYILQKGASDA